MKVLGVGDDKYICEVSEDELYEIVNGNEYNEALEVGAGDEISLTRVLRAAKWVRELDQENIERVIRELNTTLHGMEKVKDTVQALTLFGKLADKETA